MYCNVDRYECGYFLTSTFFATFVCHCQKYFTCAYIKYIKEKQVIFYFLFSSILNIYKVSPKKLVSILIHVHTFESVSRYFQLFLIWIYNSIHAYKWISIGKNVFVCNAIRSKNLWYLCMYIRVERHITIADFNCQNTLTLHFILKYIGKNSEKNWNLLLAHSAASIIWK